MIDIFDIIGDQKVVHINIEGEVSSDSLFYDIEYINELTNLLLDNQKDVDFKIFDVKEYKDSEPLRIDRFGMHGASQYERTISNIEFRIDVYITNRLNREIDESMQDFIDFFTKGAIIYNNKKYNRMDDLIQGFVDYSTGNNTFTVDAQEEYMSNILNNISALDYMYSWEEDNNEWSGIGSHPLREYRERHHDADGDGHTAVFASRLMGIPNGMQYQIDPGEIIGRPVRGGRF